MSIVQREYGVWEYKLDKHGKKIDFPLPAWFRLANPKYKKIVKILGASGSVDHTDDNSDIGDIVPFPLITRLVSNVSVDTPLNGFVMMINNYNNVKEFDLTYSNFNVLSFDAVTQLGDSFLAHNTQLIVEMEIMLVDESS
jgi:hypothetical protein